MTTMHRRFVFAAVASLWIAAHGVASADQTAKQRAESLFDDGRRYLGQKEYALACTAFEQSQVSDPAIGTQLNIALCYESWGKMASAYRAYLEAEKTAIEKKDSRAAGARKKVDELAPKVPHLSFTLPADVDPSVVFLFDGKEIEAAKLKDDLLVDAGRRHPLSRPSRQRLLRRLRTRRRRPSSPPRSRPHRSPSLATPARSLAPRIERPLSRRARPNPRQARARQSQPRARPRNPAATCSSSGSSRSRALASPAHHQPRGERWQWPAEPR